MKRQSITSPTLILESSNDHIPLARSEYRKRVESYLNSYLNEESSVPLLFDSYGKPYTKSIQHIAFSYSHSGANLAVAIQPHCDAIGVDIELFNRSIEIGQVANLAFSKKELRNISSTDYVYRWCLKEAAVKRLGHGFRNYNPSEISVLPNQEKYTLEINSEIVQEGYFGKVMAGDCLIVICSELPIPKINVRKILR